MYDVYIIKNIDIIYYDDYNLKINTNLWTFVGN